MFIIYILIHFRKRTSVHFKWIVYSYALLEALRAALLHTENVGEISGYIARFVLVILACNCVLVAERCDNPKSLKNTYCIAVLEVVVYVVFLIGFPGVLYGTYNKFLPFVGVLIAGSLSLFQTARVQQMQEE
jgi:presenilin-like A22 family membrane protease